MCALGSSHKNSKIDFKQVPQACEKVKFFGKYLCLHCLIFSASQVIFLDLAWFVFIIQKVKHIFNIENV